MKDVKTAVELVNEYKKKSESDIDQEFPGDDVLNIIKIAQKDAIEVAMSRAEEEFKVVEIEEVSPMSNHLGGTRLVYRIDHMSVFECKEKLTISIL